MNHIQTILLDMDSITKFLARKKIEERSQYPIYESIIKEGIKSLSAFQVIAFTLGDKKYATKWLHTTHLNRLIPTVEAVEKNNSRITCDQLLKNIFLQKQLKREKVLVVSNNPKVVFNSQALNLSTCSCSLLGKEPFPTTDYKVKFLAELNQLNQNKTKQTAEMTNPRKLSQESSNQVKSVHENTNQEKANIQNIYIDQETWDSLPLPAKINLEKEFVQPLAVTDQETLRNMPTSSLVLTKSPEVELLLEQLAIPSCYLITPFNDQIERKSSQEIPIKRLEKAKSLNLRGQLTVNQ